MRKRRTVVFGETPENLIQYIKRKGWNYLNFNSFKLNSEDLAKLIPIIKKELPNLQELYLNGTILDKLPDNIGDLTNLTYIDASNNKLTRLPDSLGDHPKLKDLKLYGNNFRDLPFGDSDKIPPNLRKVYLEGETPLSLESLLKIIGDPKLRNVYEVDRYVYNTACILIDTPNAKIIAGSLIKAYPDISVKEFHDFLKSLSAEQIQKIDPLKLSYSPDSDGKFVLSLPLSSESKEMKVLKELQNLSDTPRLRLQRSLSDDRLSERSDESQSIQKPALPFGKQQLNKEQKEGKNGRRKIFPDNNLSVVESDKPMLSLHSPNGSMNLEALKEVQNLSKKKIASKMKKSSSDGSLKENVSMSPVISKKGGRRQILPYFN